MGGYPDLNREHTVPHTVTLPLSYIHLNTHNLIILKDHFTLSILKILCWSDSNTHW